MTTTDITQEISTDLGAKANRYLWGHFARHGEGITPPIITRGEGVTIWDDKGKSYIDGLSGLFVVQVRRGRRQAGRDAVVLPAVVLRHAHGDRAVRADRRLCARRSEPRVLHDRRRRSGRVGVEAGQELLQADRQTR